MILTRRHLLSAAAAMPVMGCQSVTPPAGQETYPSMGRIVREDPAIDGLIPPGAQIEKLAEGFTWSEGPIWIDQDGYLLFSDVPRNKIHRWARGEGVSVFMDPSGLNGSDASSFREPGTNGLIAGPEGSILAADHGNRAIARIDLATRTKTLLATHYEGRRFNSPNDLVQARSGAIFFTDPPYGLKDMDASPLKEQARNGVYRLDRDGAVTLLVPDLTFPNGVALSPDEGTLYVTVSDPARAKLMAYDLDPMFMVSNGRVLKDFTSMVGPDRPGLPDGLAIDAEGRLFVTGPGGIHVLTPEGRSLGRIDPGTAAANCKLGEGGRTLFITAGASLARLRLS